MSEDLNTLDEQGEALFEHSAISPIICNYYIS